MIDDIDYRHRQTKKPEIKLDPFEEGQDCPKPQCRGRLEAKPFGPCTCDAVAPCWACENSFLACDAPGCGWSDRNSESGRG